jgi:hypothetical protein
MVSEGVGHRDGLLRVTGGLRQVTALQGEAPHEGLPAVGVLQVAGGLPVVEAL